MNAMTEHDDFEVLYMRYLHACNAHDVDAMMDFYAPGITVNDVVMPPEAVAAQFPPLFTAFPDWRWDIRHVWTGPDTIALHFTVTGTHRGTFLDVPATGRTVRAAEFTVYRIHDGAFTAVWDLMDTAALLDQIRGAA